MNNKELFDTFEKIESNKNPLVNFLGRGPSKTTCESCEFLVYTEHGDDIIIYRCEMLGALRQKRNTRHDPEWSACYQYKERES